MILGIGAYYILPIVIISLISIIIIFAPLVNPIKRSISRRKIFKKMAALVSTNPKASYKRVKNMPYDAIVSYKTDIWYIKLVLNYNLKRNLNIDNRESIYFKEDKKGSNNYYSKAFKILQNLEIENDKDLDIKKLFIIYPDTTFIYHNISKYDSEYVYPEDEIYGCHFISAVDFLNIEVLN